jgi:hypothetical protein
MAAIVAMTSLSVIIADFRRGPPVAHRKLRAAAQGVFAGPEPDAAVHDASTVGTSDLHTRQCTTLSFKAAARPCQLAASSAFRTQDWDEPERTPAVKQAKVYETPNEAFAELASETEGEQMRRALIALAALAVGLARGER